MHANRALDAEIACLTEYVFAQNAFYQLILDVAMNLNSLEYTQCTLEEFCVASYWHHD